MEFEYWNFPKLKMIGNPSFIEEEVHIPFKIKRSYWVYDVPGGEVREVMHLKNQRNLLLPCQEALILF